MLIFCENMVSVMNKKIYWKIRKRIVTVLFKCKTLFFRVFNGTETFKEYGSFRKMIARKTLFGGLRSILIALFLLLLDSLTSKIVCVFPLDKSIFTDVIIGGIGVAGVILGLYCANISSIYTAIYTSAPERVSSAFHNDRLTQKCIGSIIDYIIFSFIVIVESLLEFEIGWFTVISIILWSIIVIISYSLAGNRAYQLADIYAVADDSYNFIHKVVSIYLKKDFFSLDLNFQNHFLRICLKKIEFRKEILQYGKHAPRNYNASMLKFMQQNLILIEKYWENKGYIPRDSLWFRQDKKYRKWHLTRDSETSIALRTGTALRSREESNYWWFEDELFSINRQGINYFIENADFSSLYMYLIFMENICKIAIEYKEINYYIRQIEYIRNLIESVLVDNADEDSKKDFAGVVEILSLLYLNPILEASRYYYDYKIDNIVEEIIKEIDMGKPIIKCKLIRGSESIDFYEKIETEIAIEGYRLTPDWLMGQTIAKQEYIYLNSLIDTVREGVDRIFGLGQKYADRGMFFEGCIILTRFYEYESKLQRFNKIMKNREHDFRQRQVDKKLLWDEFRILKLKETILNWKARIPTLLSKCSSEFALKTWEKREEYPDFLGECYNHVCEDAVDSIIQNDINQFRVDFDNLSKLSLIYQEYIRTDFLKYRDLYRVEYAYYMFTSPIVEWAQIGGLAILWGEFKANHEWRNVVEKIKDGIISKDDKGIKLAEKLIEYVQNRDRFMMGIGQRTLLETRWNQMVANTIRDSEQYETKHTMFGIQLKTKSALLEAFCKNLIDMGFTNDPSEVFWVLCINPLLSEEKKFHTRYSWEDKLNA